MERTRYAPLAIVVGLAMAAIPLLIGGSATGTRTRFAPHDVKVFFTRASSMDDNCDATRGYERRTVGSDVLHDSLNALLRGPLADEKDTAASFFTRRTAGMINSVRLVDGTAYVDFDDLRKIISGASSSCGSSSLLAELNRTAKQFPTVDRVVYSFEGSVEAFYNWLQMDPPA